MAPYFEKELLRGNPSNFVFTHFPILGGKIPQGINTNLRVCNAGQNVYMQYQGASAARGPNSARRGLLSGPRRRLFSLINLYFM